MGNEAWGEGIVASIRSGVRCAAESDACIFMLADQPFVTSDDIDALLHCSADLCSADLYGRLPIIALRSGKIWGAPVLFPRQDFAALARLAGDVGAKGYAESQRRRLRFVTARDPRAFRDVDSLSDLRMLEALFVG